MVQSNPSRQLEPLTRFVQLQTLPHRLSPALRRDNMVKRRALPTFPAAIPAPVTQTPLIQTEWVIFGLLIALLTYALSCLPVIHRL